MARTQDESTLAASTAFKASAGGDVMRARAKKLHVGRSTSSRIDASVAWTEHVTSVDVSDHTAGVRAPLSACEIRARVLKATLPGTVVLDVTFPFSRVKECDPIHIFLENLPLGAIPMLAAGLDMLHKQLKKEE